MAAGGSQKGAALRANISQLVKAHSSDRDKLQPTSFSDAHIEKSEALISTSQPHSGGDTSQELLTSAGC